MKHGWLNCFIVAVGLAGGCAPNPNSPAALQPLDLDFNYFACNVLPVVTNNCSMTACHGVADHALRIYSPGKLRLKATRTLNDRDAPMTMAEAKANFASANGLAAPGATLDSSPLLRKPLVSTLGGGEHVGGPIFRGLDDPRYVALGNWLSGMKQSSAGCEILKALAANP